ncbi:MAG TPA: bacillithiol biosynthesis BshC [Candidatus Krumholzibacteria bacterium]|nr:bacillithiol biosynthesis BshC [Candidatus Krumholzibacteria bacterium]
MTTTWTPGEPLPDAVASSALFTSWFRPAGDGRDATGELAGAARAIASPAPAPWFADRAAQAWAGRLAADLPDDAARQRLDANLAALRAGRADVVVTGQQPGFLGGPLLTVHKIATAVALARQLSAAGRPTIPVFWSGDDDDDLVEAFEPAAWAGGAGLVRSELREAARRGGAARRRLGTLGVREGQEAALAWLAAQREGSLAFATWAEAADGRWRWADLQRRALLRMFAGTDLVIVSGDDPDLHAAGAPFYAEVRPKLAALADAARTRGQALAAAGFHAQIGERSLARPLFAAAGDRRVAADPGTADRDLRPGVLLRSALQDWLLRPRAVVVGPGEYAYLRQLAPVYAALGLERAPLVPRLFGWLLPDGFDRARLAEHRRVDAGPPLDDAAWRAWQDGAAASLASLLEHAGGLPAERAAALARGRLKRWRRGVDAAVRHERRSAAMARVPRDPAWIFPGGLRQERGVAWGAAWAAWGADLAPALVGAAGAHLAAGAANDWREWIITVPAPEEPR